MWSIFSPKRIQMKVLSNEISNVMMYAHMQVVFYKRINRVFFIDAIPKSPSGKILRKDLRAKLAAGLPNWIIHFRSTIVIIDIIYTHISYHIINIDQKKKIVSYFMMPVYASTDFKGQRRGLRVDLSVLSSMYK